MAPGTYGKKLNCLDLGQGLEGQLSQGKSAGSGYCSFAETSTCKNRQVAISESPSRLLYCSPCPDYSLRASLLKLWPHLSWFQELFPINGLMLLTFLNFLKDSQSTNKQYLPMACSILLDKWPKALGSTGSGLQLGLSWAPLNSSQVAAIWISLCRSRWITPNRAKIGAEHDLHFLGGSRASPTSGQLQTMLLTI